MNTTRKDTPAIPTHSDLGHPLTGVSAEFHADHLLWRMGAGADSVRASVDDAERVAIVTKNAARAVRYLTAAGWSATKTDTNIVIAQRNAA